MSNMMSAIEFFQKGGSVMYVLLVCSLLVVSIGIERFTYYKRVDDGRDFAEKFCSLMEEKNFFGAAEVLANGSGVLSGLLKSAIEMLKDGASAERVAGYLEIQSGIAISKLRQRLYYLNVIVTMAPLLGLLGTISGMIGAFSVFNIQSGQATAITGGVGEALIATAMGLCVAIMSLVVHAYFNQRLENIITDMEQCFSYVENNHGELAKESGFNAAS